MEMKDIIHKYRKDLGLSQEELGRRIGTTKQAIQKYESGSVTNIPYDKIISLSNALNISPTILLGIDYNVYDGEQTLLIERFSALNDEKRTALLQYAKFLLEQA